MVQKGAKTDGQNGQKQTAPKLRKRAKECKDGRKQAKTGKKVRKRSECFVLIFLGHFRMIFQWPESGALSSSGLSPLNSANTL